MNRAELSRVYAAQGLTVVQSTKGNPHKGKAGKSRKHKIEFNPKPRARHKPSPAVRVPVKIKTHVTSPYEELQLENRALRDQLVIEIRKRRAFLATIMLLLEGEPNEGSTKFVYEQIVSELKRMRQ